MNYQLENAEEIHFFGHSLGETDHTYFTDFFFRLTLDDTGMSPKKIYLYYYGDDSYENIYKQLNILTKRSMTAFKQKNVIEYIDTSRVGIRSSQ